MNNGKHGQGTHTHSIGSLTIPKNWNILKTSFVSTNELGSRKTSWFSEFGHSTVVFAKAII